MKRLLLALLLTATLVTYGQDKPVKQQCKGITVKGKQCLNPAQANKEYCHVHDLENRCKGHTGKGVQCKRAASKGSDKCWQHVNQRD